MKGLFRPSQQVQRVLNTITTPPCEKCAPNVRQLALVIRTGNNEYNQFLSEGDEQIFVRCLNNYVREEHLRSAGAVKLYRVLVTSDSSSVKEQAAALVRDMYARYDEAVKRQMRVEVVTLTDSVVHIMSGGDHGGGGGKGGKLNLLVKTYAEYFAIARCDVKFLTHGSLFGQTAAERRDDVAATSTEATKAAAADVFYISDSNCDGLRSKYSYLECHYPKYPVICGMS